MSTHYRFKQTIKVNGVPYTNGQVVPKSAINAGNAAAMLSIQQLEECDAPPPEPAPEPAKPVAPEVKPEVKLAAKPEKK